MSKPTVYEGIRFADGTLSLSGNLTVHSAAQAEQAMSHISKADIVVIDGSGLEELDTAGAVLINRIRKDGTELRGFSESALTILDISLPSEKPAPAPTRKRFSLESFGGMILCAVDNLIEIAVLVVDTIYWGAVGLFNRSQYRRGSFVDQAFYMGSTALPIIATIMFLIGAISALQSSATLRQFGASIFVADMLAIGLARELAPLMTAIIVSGRSGSAIASEIATMKFTEELDAIRTMGMNPLRFVVVPKLWALVFTMPMLTLMALGFGLLGGFLVAVSYIGLAPATFMNRLLISLFFWDITTGLIKSVSFAIIITIVGTYRGLKFKGGADGVGRATTESVVSSIFAIIVMDSIWGIIFYFKV